jgi:hypothetical protein
MRIVRQQVAVPLALAIVSAFLLVLPMVASAAPSAWWQVLPGSRPTNLWEPEEGIQEIETELAEVFGSQVVGAKIEVGGELVGCLGVQNGIGSIVCEFFVGFPVTETASQLEALLKEKTGTESLEVTGGPAGGENFKIVTTGAVPALQITEVEPEPGFTYGKARLKVIQEGGSGRLIVTATNLGDLPVNATQQAVTIKDELPEGVLANGVVARAGVYDSSGPVDCSVEDSSLISCTFEGTLPSYEAIELEIPVSLTGEPPAAGSPGKVTVSGGNASPKAVTQAVKVSPDKTPFGFEYFSADAEEEGGAQSAPAGVHPFQLTTTIQLNSGRSEGELVEQPALPRNVRFKLPAGLIGNATVTPRCSMESFFQRLAKHNCPPEAAIGVASVTVVEPLLLHYARLAIPVFNLPPGLGEPARFGFAVKGAPVVIGTQVDPDDHYRITAEVRNATEVAQFLSSTVTLWGNPGDPRHDNARGWNCMSEVASGEPGPCVRPGGLTENAFFRNPVSCVTPVAFRAQLEPWNVPEGSVIDEKSVDDGTLSGCNQIPFNPEVSASPTSGNAGGSSGLDFQLNMPNAGLLDGDAIAEGQAKKVEVVLPQGMTINPSQAEGLGACSPADYARETASSPPGAGCPESSKVGTVQISTPLLEEEAQGDLYIAKPYDNPFGSLLALYMVAKIPQRGILVKQAGKVELNRVTGQVVTTFDELPQIPFHSFKVHFFEGNRAPLVMPEACGTYQLETRFTPWHAADPSNPSPSEIITKNTPLTVDRGANGAACPSGTPPFHPGFTAGTENNAAGGYSPFTARLTREDGEQEFSRFSLKLPKGVIGNLSGIPFCSEAAIAQARSRTGANGGQEELDSPSCPAASQIGRTVVGAGAGPALTYVSGKLYLAGPYQGAKLSAVAITPAKVGPFDLGNVVIRQSLKVDPVTAEVSTDGSSSDPIPHILQGIVVHARDIRVLVDRDHFVLNPTSCERMTASASISGLAAVSVSSPFQAADCASLGFKPKLALSLSGGTKRTANPRLKAVLTARKGDANIGAAVVALPHSEFLEQGHIRTICTRVQFNAGGGNGEQCPKGSIYGRVKAVTPLLDEPLTGPVYLRSSNHPLPDLVAALHSGKVDINLAGRIDAVHGGIRNSFEAVPDAPVTKFTLEMQGGKKGLLVNSTNICRGKHRAAATFTGQNGKRFEAHPLLKAKCGGKKKRKKH